MLPEIERAFRTDLFLSPKLINNLFTLSAAQTALKLMTKIWDGGAGDYYYYTNWPTPIHVPGSVATSMHCAACLVKHSQGGLEGNSVASRDIRLLRITDQHGL